MATIVVEAIGDRLGIGKVKFGDVEGYKGKCAVLDEGEAGKLVASSPASWAFAKKESKRTKKEQA